ncbi:hypothetical protein PRNP1_011855 [Phytophthora ramorum]
MATKRKRGRGVGPRLNDLQRLEIIRKHQSAEPPLSLRQLARDYEVDEKTIRRVVAASADIEARANSSAILNRRGQVHRRPTPRFPELERTLVAWIDARQRARAEISPSVVIDKAKLVARAMGIRPDDFKASWGWYDKFSRRYGVRAAFVGGAEVTTEQNSGYTFREVKTLQELHAVMAEYDPEWVFTVEETSLFYDALPFDAELVGEKKTRNRVTLVVSCNSTGRVTLPICLVGKEKGPSEGGTPRPGRPSSFPSPYLMQERAWLDRATFGRWYSSVFVPFVRERTSKPVLLVVDRERPGHQGDFEDEGIRAVFLPHTTQSPPGSVGAPGTTPVNLKTWWRRPLQMSVVAVLKAQYKYLLVQSALSYHNAPQEVKAALQAAEKSDNGYSGGVHFGHRPTLLDAARLLDQAWGQIPDDLLENCFARANLVPPSKLLAAPAPPTGSEIPFATVTRYRDEIASKIEDMLGTSSLPGRVWITSDLSTPANTRDRVYAFLNVDEDSSIELQQQLQGEINEVLCDEPPAVLTAGSVVPTPVTDANDRDANHPGPERPDLESQIHGLLLGITGVATQLRLLPRSGTDAEKLAPLQLEGCIAAADQIRHCIQAFDRTLHTESIEERQTRGKIAAAKHSHTRPEGQL